MSSENQFVEQQFACSQQSLITLQNLDFNIQNSSADDQEFSLFRQKQKSATSPRALNSFYGQDEDGIFNEDADQSVEQIDKDDPDFHQLLSNRPGSVEPFQIESNFPFDVRFQEPFFNQQPKKTNLKQNTSSLDQTKVAELAVRDILPVLQLATPVTAQQEVRFAETIEPAKRNCKSSSRQTKSIQMVQIASEIRSGTQSFVPQLGLSQLIQNNQVQFPLTAGRQHNSYSQSTQQEVFNKFNSGFPQNISKRPIAVQPVTSLQQRLHINLKNINQCSVGSNQELSDPRFALPNQGIQNKYKMGQQAPNSPMYPLVQQFVSGGGITFGGADDQHVAPIQKVDQKIQQLLPHTIQTNDPYFYLQQMRQQKHKSSRSAYPSNNNLLQKVQNDQRTMRTKNGNRSCSSNSFSSNTTAIKSLSEVKNPSLLISFRFVNRAAENLSEIQKFRNLTDLDLGGNLLREEVPELRKLSFLKKLSIAGNKIEKMWSLPTTLEFLNISKNLLTELAPSICQDMPNLKVLDVSNNRLKSLIGLEHLTRIKRFICQNNQVNDLYPLINLMMLVEIDLQNNPIESNEQIVQVIISKKEILILNLRQTPIALKTDSAELLYANDPCSSQALALLSHYRSDVLYRNKRVYSRIKQQIISQQQMMTKRSNSNFSYESGNRQQVFSQLQPKRRMLSASPQSSSTIPQRFDEAIEQLYDKILEDEDKLLLAEQRKLKRERNDSCSASSSSQNDEVDDIGSSDISIDSEELDDLQTFNHDEEQFLNESTADFNKEIKQIQQELIQDGLIDPKSREVVTPHDKKLIKQDFQIIQETSEEQSSKFQPMKPLPSFKLDLSKCQTEQDISEVAIDIENDIHIQFQGMSKEPESNLEQTPKRQIKEPNQQRKQLSPKPQVHVLRKQQPVQPKAIFIPRLALQNIQIQQTDIAQSTQSQEQSTQQKFQFLKQSIKVLSSKRGNSSGNTGQPSPCANLTPSINIALKHQQSVEVTSLQNELDRYKKLIKQIKSVCLIDEKIAEDSLVQTLQKRIQFQEHLQMQNEDLMGQIIRLTEQSYDGGVMQGQLLGNLNSASQLSIQHQPSMSKVQLKQQTHRDPKNYESIISEIYKTGKLQLTNRDMLSNRIKTRQESKLHLTSREVQNHKHKLDQQPIRAETVIERHDQNEDPIATSISVSSLDNRDSNRNKLEDAKKLIMQSLKREFYSKPKPLLQNLQTPAYNVIIEDEYSVGPAQEETKLSEFQNQAIFHPAKTNGELNHTFTARSGTYSSMQDTTRTNQASEVTQKLMSDYLTQLRERNSSLQERLNQSFKGTRLDPRPLTAMKGVMRTDRGSHNISNLLKYQTSQQAQRPDQQWQPLQKYYQVNEALSQLSGKTGERNHGGELLSAKKTKKKRQQSVKSLYKNQYQRGQSPHQAVVNNKRGDNLLTHKKANNNWVEK